MAEKKFTFERNSNSLLHRWSGIQLSVNKLCGYMAKIEGRSQSGVNEKDRDQPKWITETSKKKSKTSPNASPASSSPCIPCAVNLGEDSQESTCIERPEEQEQLAIRHEEVLIQRRSEDSRIMAMDTTNMLPMQAEYIIGLQ
ncbi:hypothetical protein CerSpe_161610 [Prunus speciosa]